MCGRLNTATNSLPYFPTSGEFYFPSSYSDCPFSCFDQKNVGEFDTIQVSEPKLQEVLQLMSSLSKNSKLELHAKTTPIGFWILGNNKFVIFLKGNKLHSSR